jgi:hypothetical protein
VPTPGPYELLELADGQELAVTVRGIDQGEIRFLAGRGTEPTTSPLMRLHVDAGEKPAGLPYYDVSSKTLQAQLAGLAGSPDQLPRRIRLRARGAGLGKRYELAIGPTQEAAGSP